MDAADGRDTVTVETLTPARVAGLRAPLAALLQDAVADGASLGFLPPLPAGEAAAYWDTVAAAVGQGSRVLLVAGQAGHPVAGAVQLDLAQRPNARHRAEVAKLMVHTACRRRGLGRALMAALEAEAGRQGRTTLVLDTRAGDPSEGLYRALGWTRVGTIPRYARSAGGTLDATALYFKLLDAGPGAAP